MKRPVNASQTNDDGCADCPLDGGRRTFLWQAGLGVFGALFTAGLPEGLAAMIPSRLAALHRVNGNPIYPIPLRDGVQIDKENDVILVRWEHNVMAFNLSCPHQNTALRWSEKDAQFQCPKHHSKYTPDGTFISGRATRNMDRFTLARMGDAVVVNTQVMHKNDKDPTGWNASVVVLPAKE